MQAHRVRSTSLPGWRATLHVSLLTCAASPADLTCHPCAAAFPINRAGMGSMPRMCWTTWHTRVRTTRSISSNCSYRRRP